MYYPYIRGKMFELIMLREMASTFSKSNIIPIIEPVKKNLNSLRKALEVLIDHNCRYLLISNPKVGDLSRDSSSILEEINNGKLAEYENFSPTIILSARDDLSTARALLRQHDRSVSIVHSGFSEGKKLSNMIKTNGISINEHIFADPSEELLYRRHFTNGIRVIVRDGFNYHRNKDYPASEPFSELYLTYEELKMNGFGDYLIVGKDYKDSGGPAYAIAIHLTYIEPDADDIISVKHYVSTRVDTPKDPAGKFIEALDKLVKDVNVKDSLILRTNALDEFLALHKKKHFPGLGHVKKLSMMHHIELVAHLISD